MNTTTDEKTKDLSAQGNVKVTDAKTAAEKDLAEKATAEAKAAAAANPNQSTKTVQPVDPSKAPAGGPHPNGLKEPEQGSEPETLTDEQLAALIGKDASESDTNEQLLDVTEDAIERAKGSHAKVVKLVKSFPKGIDRNHTMFGYGGIVVTVGDLLNLFDPELRS